MADKLKVTGADGYVQLFDDLKPLNADVDLSGVVAAPLPTSVSNIDDAERERTRLLSMPAR